LNPLRAKVVPDLRALDRYPWTGHSALLGTVARPWQSTRDILTQFGASVARARRAYRAFVAAGVPLGHRPEFQGGGLVRSCGGWAAVAALRRGREAFLSDERILGSSEFVEAARKPLMATTPPSGLRRPLVEIVAQVRKATGCSPAALRHGSRVARVARAREGIACLALEGKGYAGRVVAGLLGVGLPSIYKAAQRGRAASDGWNALRYR